ncbi:MAG TPA: NAD(P)/FAD-dependent oxidoreductase [Woeseiaceae bacterium]
MRHDAIIIGGSFAGLSAALYIARARRSACIVDTGLPRNRFAPHSHGFFGQDGSEPAAMLATAHTQVAAYPTATFVEDKAVKAAKAADVFSVELATGEVFECSRLVLAFGVSDELPGIPGLAERWGKSVLHCPYCHGYEFSGRRLGVLNVSPMSVQQAMLIAEWGPTTFYLNGTSMTESAALPPPAGGSWSGQDALAELERRGVAIEPAPVTALHGEGDGLSAIELGDGRMSPADALYIGPRFRLNSRIAEQLGCEMDEAPLGRIIRTDEQKATTVPGVYAAGDITRGAHTVTWACADGVMAGLAVHRSLVF